eukprot:1379384-Prymnesium_polylepis.1
MAGSAAHASTNCSPEHRRRIRPVARLPRERTFLPWQPMILCSRPLADRLRALPLRVYGVLRRPHSTAHEKCPWFLPPAHSRRASLGVHARVVDREREQPRGVAARTAGHQTTDAPLLTADSSAPVATLDHSEAAVLTLASFAHQLLSLIPRAVHHATVSRRHLLLIASRTEQRLARVHGGLRSGSWGRTHAPYAILAEG